MFSVLVPDRDLIFLFYFFTAKEILFFLILIWSRLKFTLKIAVKNKINEIFGLPYETERTSLIWQKREVAKTKKKWKK